MLAKGLFSFTRKLISPFPILLLFLLICCNEMQERSKKTPVLSDEDIEQIRRICRDYSEGWEDNDSARVLGLYADSSVINPSGLLPIQGLDSIRNFWFPNDGSITTIHSYDLEILDIGGAGDFAYTYERGNLSFTYVKGDFRMDRETESYAITIYQKMESGDWKITNRIWSDLKK